MDSSIRAKTDIGALASRDSRSASVMMWNYHDDDEQGVPELIKLSIDHLPAKTVTVIQYRIDNEHSNSYELWKKMGSPQQPTAAQIAELEKAGQLQTLGKATKAFSKNGKLILDVSMPRQAVSLIKFNW